VLALAALVVVAASVVALAGQTGRAAGAPAPRARGATERAVSAPIIAYRGLGAWVDIFDSWSHPVAIVDSMAAHGVRTLYIETANWHSATALTNPSALAQFITAAHARGMRVVAWYLPQFKSVSIDRARSLAAVRFTTPGGQKFDSFALDIEDSSVARAATRTANLLALSQQLRAAVGRRYPLGAIIPSPVGMTIHAAYWPNFPYRQLAAIYDVLLPMGYYTYHGQGPAHAYEETCENISIIRAQTGKPGIPIHVIGGSAGNTSPAEVQAFTRAVRERGVIGASLYDYATTSVSFWQYLRLLPVNPRQNVALPVPLGYSGILGNVPRHDTSHPKEVFFNVGRPTRAQVLHYRVYDAQKYEIRLLVNWTTIAYVKPGPKGRWSAERTIVIPARRLSNAGDTIIGFVARGDYPRWHIWGVRGVALTPAGQ
jgi:hypothetical protein